MSRLPITGPRIPAPTRRQRPLHTLAARLTERDLWLLDMLLEHSVLTSTHIAQLLRTSRRSATRRLRTLVSLDLLTTFRPQLPLGSAPMHYTLGRTGAALLAARLATTPGALGWRPDTPSRIAFSPTLVHDLGVADFFSVLAQRSTTAAHLSTWWSERRCREQWGDLARPDAYGTSATPTSSASYFLEHDTGSEPLTQLARKLDDFAQLAIATRSRPLVLFSLHSGRREVNLHQRFTAHPTLDRLAVATFARDQPLSPADAAWLPVGGTGRRLALVELPNGWPTERRPSTAALAEGADRACSPAPHPLSPGHPARPRP
ncbi:replication-relaxation family protein [Kitasatospora viridis]|uniref:Protein involved in plasmid replication-relaxation n=1 Tax=Kitasatospora viridis TaxID=281105 RepID=A0A561TW47_9ACTN|nr:replication-relaxation family protein [Kitasatospora viridis]TWF91335.1 protein involved in plasmid replication-relaxation [Kitasatospora viridis]